MSQSGLRAVFLAERPALLRLLRARLGDPAEAEDALQDLWLKLDQGSGPIAQPAAYLYRMANNIALDRRRAAARRSLRDGEWAAVQPAAAEHPTAEQALVLRDRLARIEAALADMPERTARAFHLSRLEGLRQREVAEAMGISQSAVEKLLHRAYRHLFDAAERLEGGENGSPRRPDREGVARHDG